MLEISGPHTVKGAKGGSVGVVACRGGTNEDNGLDGNDGRMKAETLFCPDNTLKLACNNANDANEHKLLFFFAIIVMK